MRKSFMTIVVLTIFILQPICLFSAQKWTAHDGNLFSQQNNMKILSSGMSELVITVAFDGISSEDVITREGEYLSLVIPEEGYTTIIGHPQLPVFKRLFEFSYGASLTATVMDMEVSEYDLTEFGTSARILPLQEPLPKVEGAGDRAVFSIDESRYSTDEFWPELGVEVEEAGIIREHSIGLVKLNSVSYNPVQSKIRVVTNITVRVEMSGGNPGFTQRAVGTHYSRHFEEILSNVLINYPLFSPSSPPALPVGYLVITHDDFSSQIADMVAWKQKKGFDVTVTSVSDISPQTPTGIQTYIREAYNTWPVPPTYVLLVGDDGFIPAFQGGESNSVTDLYYAAMNPEDYLMDLSVGRLTVRNPTDMNNVMAKIMDYEYNLPVVNTWQENAVFMASLDNYQISEGTNNYVIENYLEPAGLTCHKIYARLGGDTQDITNNLNAGRTIANYTGHGSQTSWANPGFSQSNINALSNDSMYPFVISNACLTGDFEVTECFGETWLKAAGKGAIAHWGASNNSYWDEDDILEKRLWRAVFQDTVFEIGSMTDQALLELYEHYGGGGSCQYYFEIYNVFGDPSIDLWSDVATDIVATHPSAVILGTVPVSVSVTMNGSPVPYALVCLKKEGEVLEAGYTDFSGLLTLTVTTTSPGDLDVTVTAHNGIPYEDVIQVVPPTGPYVILDDYLVDDSVGGNGDNTIDFGETIALEASAKNVGIEVASNVFGILITEDTYVTMTDSVISFGDIDPDETKWGAEAFDFDVSSETPDGHSISFMFIASDGVNIWETPFSLVCQAPVLVYDSNLIDDSFGGNGNGGADPGETIDIYVSLFDDATGEASGIWADLSSSDPYMTITVDHAEYPDVQAGGIVVSLTGYRVEISPDCPGGYIASFDLDIGANGPYSNSDSFEILVGMKPILLVDDDGANYQTYFTSSLDDLGYPFDTWTYSSQGTPTLATLQLYRTVIWTTADDYGSPGTLTAQDEAVLMDYLDGGGTLFLSSQDFLYDNGLDTFATQYLHVSWYESDNYISQVTGIQGDPIGDGMVINLNYPFSNWSDDMQHDTQAATVFENTGYSAMAQIRQPGALCPDAALEEGGRAYAGACRYPAEGASDFRTVFFAFPFESIPQGEQANTVMDNIIQWLWNAVPSVSISLDPDAVSFPQGGTLGYTLTATNNTSSPQNVSYWTNITIPGYGTYPPSGYLMGPVNGTLSPDQVINVHISHEIPSNAPTLSYTFNAYAGPHPDYWDYQTFDFTVVEGEAGGKFVDDWNLVENGLEAEGFILGTGEELTLSSMSPLPRTYAMLQNYPNPFNPQTTVRYDVPESVGEGVKVDLKVFSIRGRLVRTLVEEVKEPGRYVVYWNGRSDSGEELSSGIYIYKMTAGDFTSTRKMLLMK